MGDILSSRKHYSDSFCQKLTGISLKASQTAIDESKYLKKASTKMNYLFTDSWSLRWTTSSHLYQLGDIAQNVRSVSNYLCLKRIAEIQHNLEINWILWRYQLGEEFPEALPLRFVYMHLTHKERNQRQRFRPTQNSCMNSASNFKTKFRIYGSVHGTGRKLVLDLLKFGEQGQWPLFRFLVDECTSRIQVGRFR